MKRTLWVLGLLAAAATAQAGFRDLDDGWLLEPSAAATLLGHGDATPAGTVWRSGTGRLYGMPGLELVLLGVDVRSRAVRAELAWQRLGGDLWCEDRIRLRAARGPLALLAASRSVRVAGDPAAGRLDVALELDLRPAPGWRLRARTDAAVLLDGCAPADWSPWLAVDHEDADRAVGVRLDRRTDGAVALRGGCTLAAGGGLAVGLLCGATAGELGLTTSWRRGRLLIRSSHLVHPALGATHRWQLALLAKAGT